MHRHHGLIVVPYVIPYMRDRKDVTVGMPKSMKQAIEDQLGYNDYKTEVIREAILTWLEEEGVDTDQIRADIQASDSEDASESPQAAD